MKKQFTILLITILIIIASMFSVYYFFRKEKIIYIYNAFGGSGDVSRRIPLGKNYHCETLKSSEEIYYGEEKNNIAETYEFSLDIKDEVDYKILELKASPLGNSRSLLNVKFWVATLFCLNKNYGEFKWLDGLGDINN